MKASTRLHIIPFIASLSFFMGALDATIINTAIPAMSHSLKVNPIDLKTALISYLLSLAIFLPISGWLADRFGTKRIFILSGIIFTASSLWCGFSHSLPELILARFIQGLGSALGTPTARLIILRNFQRNKIIDIMRQVVMIGGLGMMLGPLLGGIITHHLSWHWIFWVNIPIGCLEILLIIYCLPPMEPQPVAPLDKVGFVLLGFALASFTFGLSILSKTNQSHEIALVTIGLSMIFMFTYVWHSHHIENPIIKISLFHYRTFKISIIAILLSRLSFAGISFLLVLLLQVVFGFTSQTSGLLIAPIALGILIVKPFMRPLLRIGGFKYLLITNFLLLGIFLWLFLLIEKSTPLYLISGLTFLFGIFTSINNSAIISLAYSDIQSENLSSATSIMSTIQQVSQGFSIAICAILIEYFAFLTSHRLVFNTQVFHYTFFALGVITLFSCLIFLPMKAEDGKQLLTSDEQIQ